MNYSDFIKAIQKMGTGFPIPNLGYRSYFYIAIEKGDIKIINSCGNSRLFNQHEWELVRQRFCNAPSHLRFRVYYYARGDKNHPNKESWDKDNPDVIFSGYLPALFRELYVKTDVSVCNCPCIWEGIKESYKGLSAKRYFEQISFYDFNKLKKSEKLPDVGEISEKNLKKIKEAIKEDKKTSFGDKALKIIEALGKIIFGGIHVNVNNNITINKK